MARALIGILDSFGVGATQDAHKFGDEGANTFAHIAEACARGEADKEELRSGPLKIPNLMRLGLGELAREATGAQVPVDAPSHFDGAYGFAAEKSYGKDTPSGHWEMMGLPVEFDWGMFAKGPPSFPEELLRAFIEQADLPGVLGDKHASGTIIIEELGEEHIKTGKPIVYTSADSVFQIAAHEKHFGLERLYDVCAIARKLVDDYNVGRVIARPFVGERKGEFERTGNRRDLATPPHEPTLLDIYAEMGRPVIGIGKISDIFAGSGITKSVKAHGNDELFDIWLKEIETAPDDAIIFANFVDFDSLYGHRRNVPGYAAALETFDARLPELEAVLKPDDVVILSADHGCDPTWPGSDHTREYIPVIAFGEKVSAGSIGKRDTFADIGQSLASHLGIAPLKHGVSFLG
ncbi:phosphopentomutase [Hyphococcus flavus]|uniref:Phosphopentomutase n=1 Tax=Hyphococcus flavus TaxID=1866326 RepID=A0AAE9ZC62_9PROT|nr:phosphopentomutase [Hyphococcus flavus]WDI30172.1 phosphopentomutase [Hyphococcus flavus]